MPHLGEQTRDQVEAKIMWTKYIQIDRFNDARGVCVFGDYIAVLGGVNCAFDKKGKYLK